MPRKLKAILVSFVALLMVFVLNAVGASASDSENDDDTQVQVPDLKPAGWKRSMNHARYHGPDANGKVTFWSADVNGSWFTIDPLSGPNYNWEGFVTVYDNVVYPAVMKLKNCGEKTRVEIRGRYMEWYTIPAWPCKKGASDEVNIKIKSVRLVKPSAAPPYAWRGLTVVRGSVSPASKVRRVRVAVRKDGKRVTHWSSARGGTKWRASFDRRLKSGRYTVVVRAFTSRDTVITSKRTFRVRR